jgi:spore coat polysaccharide biosynthesis protein SpsF
MITAAIIAARMESGRLPGKVLADLGGAPMLDRVVARAAACPDIGPIVIATSDRAADDPIAARAGELGVAVFRGSADDVLARYAGAARLVNADVVVGLTADCPLLDPAVISAVVRALGAGTDYASNTHTRSFPRGLDVEAMHADVLIRIARAATSDAAREHVTAFVLEQPALFSVCQVVAPRDDSDLRITVDTPEDLVLVRAIWDGLGLGARIAPYRDVVTWLRARPVVRATNSHVIQKSWRTTEVRS